MTRNEILDIIIEYKKRMHLLEVECLEQMKWELASKELVSKESEMQEPEVLVEIPKEECVTQKELPKKSLNKDLLQRLDRTIKE